jgi:hypothetical protein
MTLHTKPLRIGDVFISSAGSYVNASKHVARPTQKEATGHADKQVPAQQKGPRVAGAVKLTIKRSLR